jgi:hypothetical protein
MTSFLGVRYARGLDMLNAGRRRRLAAQIPVWMNPTRAELYLSAAGGFTVGPDLLPGSP